MAMVVPCQTNQQSACKPRTAHYSRYGHRHFFPREQALQQLTTGLKRAEWFTVAHLLMVVAALAGGFTAYLIGAPMPFLIGGVIGSAIFVVSYEKPTRRLGKIHPYIRPAAIAATGAMIGSKVTPGLLSVLPAFWISAIAILPFVLLAHAGSYAMLRHVGKYNVTDAYFAAMPGGLVEALLLGEKAGADTRVLTVQHFIRVLSVVVVVPLLFYLLTGEVVGSAASTSGSTTPSLPYNFVDIALIVLLGAVGMFVGRKLRIPAGHLMGPLILAVIVSISGVADIIVPEWLLHTAQLVVGTTLGAQFSGIGRALLQRCFKMGILTVTYMLMLGFVFASLLEPYVPADVSAMFVSFAAGGLAEMSLIALSLDLSPLIVALHHLIRIFLTIYVGNQIFQRYFVNSKE